MNSYPVELVNQHYACMLVAGLNPAAAAATAAVSPAPQTAVTAAGETEAQVPPSPVTPTTSVPSTAMPHAMPPTEVFPTLCKDLVDMFNSRGRTSVWDPARRSAAVFHSVLVEHTVRLPPRKTRPNPRSVAAPPSALSTAPNGTSPSASSSSASAQSSTAAQFSSLAARSPLSPLHPGSPLFSDGIIAPIWVRKHRELVPAVFVAFHCLAEPPHEVATSNDGQEDAQTPALLVADDIDDLKRRDEELIRAIAERKRTLVERGIKLTVVLLATRSLLEHPSLEARLSHIRRSSGLDSKASLFVLTPVTRAEVNDFVTSLQSALYDPALDFYREHARRVRRKRGRYPPPPSIVQPILAAVASSSPPGKGPSLAPLSREGWQVRAEYKLGTFAEFQSDRDAALGHYMEAYDLLVNSCLGSTMILPPRTKRWAEAKVLADALCVRIARLHLYADNTEAAFKIFQRHLQRFIELSTGWGIGAATFEFWSWLAKQYRMFGDLVDAATREIAGAPLPPVRLPEHVPVLPSNIIHPELLVGIDPASISSRFPEQLLPTPAAAALGAAPATMLAGSGIYYYLAALCTVERRDRFRKAAAEEVDGSSSGALAYQHEQSVDHVALITEAYTRAYETFKRQKQQRVSLFLASKIALTYASGSQPEMALRFLERISRTYRREGWTGPLAGLLLVAVQCAQEIGDVESEARLLFELLSVDLVLARPHRREAARVFGELLATKQLPEGKGPVRVSTSATDGPLGFASVFYAPAIDYSRAVPFQLRLTASEGGQTLSFDELRISVSEETEAIIVKAGEQSSGDKIVTDLGNIELGRQRSPIEGKGLRWQSGTERVFEGLLLNRRSGPVRITSVTLLSHTAVPFEWTVELPLPEQGSPLVQPVWKIPGSTSSSSTRDIALPYRSDPSSTFVRARQPRLTTSTSHASVAYLDEAFDIDVSISNDDTEPISCSLDVFLRVEQAAEWPGDMLRHGEQEAPSVLRSIEVGTLGVGASEKVSFVLMPKHFAGLRTVDIVLHSTPEASTAAETTLATSSTISERTLTLDIDAVAALAMESTVSFSSVARQGAEARQESLQRSASGLSALDGGQKREERREQDLFETDEDDSYVTASLCAVYECLSEEGVRVRSTRLNITDGGEAEKDASESRNVWLARHDAGRAVELDEDEGTWEARDRFAVFHELEVACPQLDFDHQSHITSSPGYLEVVWSRRNSQAHITTRFPLPTLSPPVQPAVSLTLTSPTLARLSAPLELALTAHNASSTLSAHLHIAIDSSDAFVFAGPRIFDMPVLLPSQTRVVRLRLVPLVVGRAPLPNVRAWDTRRYAGASGEAHEGEPVKIQHEHAVSELALGDDSRKAPPPPPGAPFTVLVLPD